MLLYSCRGGESAPPPSGFGGYMIANISGTVLDAGVRSFEKNGENVEFGRVVLSQINSRGYQDIITCTCSAKTIASNPPHGDGVAAVDIRPRRGGDGYKFRFLGWRAA